MTVLGDWWVDTTGMLSRANLPQCVREWSVRSQWQAEVADVAVPLPGLPGQAGLATFWQAGTCTELPA